LAKALENLPSVRDPRVLVGMNTADDAGVIRLHDDLALVQSVDFFTPIVDDPYIYGQISAANSLSDIYAMGGTPLSALNIVGFPKEIFSLDVLAEILQGGFDKAREGNTVIIGGHTISDEELKYGLAVTGTVHPNHILTNSGARAGDLLFLTKPIGTGTVTTALKAGKGSAEMEKRVCRIMVELNKQASEICRQIGVHACTDITGFGLLGHALEMAQASKTGLVFQFNRIPVLEDAKITAGGGHIPGGSRANRLFVAPHVHYAENIGETEQLLLNDAQTSGGLLISVSEKKAKSLQQAFSRAEISAPIVGHVTELQDQAIGVV